MLEKILLVAAGSAVGGLSRFFLMGWGNRFGAGNFPYGTMLVNLSGCFIAGVLVAVTVEKIPLGENGKLLLLMGFCGAFTTFSAVMMDTEKLVSGGFFPSAMMNVALSFFAGYLLFCVGVWLGKIL